jgi:hypothetical protein
MPTTASNDKGPPESGPVNKGPPESGPVNKGRQKAAPVIVANNYSSLSSGNGGILARSLDTV